MPSTSHAVPSHITTRADPARCRAEMQRRRGPATAGALGRSPKSAVGGIAEAGGDGEVVGGVGGEVCRVPMCRGGGEGRFSQSPRRADQFRPAREADFRGFCDFSHKSGRLAVGSRARTAACGILV